MGGTVGPDRAKLRRWALGLAVIVGTLAGASPASATTTIGQVAPPNPPSTCSGMLDIIQPTVVSGTSYVVPPGGVAITSWSTSAWAGSGQTYMMKVFRLVSGTTYKLVGHDGPQPLTGGVLNTFSVNVPVQPGDVLGLGTDPGTSNCVFSAPGETFLVGGPVSNDGDTGSFASSSNFRANISAAVALKPSNADTLGGVTRNKKKGTATLSVSVPGPGTLSLTGNNVKPQRLGRGASASLNVTAAGTVNLLVKAKGKAKKKLNKTGKAKVKVNVTYTPTGDLPGVPNTQTKTVKLVKKH